MIRLVAYDLRLHGLYCHCGVQFTTLNGGKKAIGVYETEDGEAHCCEDCASRFARVIDEANTTRLEVA